MRSIKQNHIQWTRELQSPILEIFWLLFSLQQLWNRSILPRKFPCLQVCMCMHVCAIYLCVGVCINLNSLATVTEALVMCCFALKQENKALRITLLKEPRFAFSILLSRCLRSFLSAYYNFELVPAWRLLLHWPCFCV